MSKTVTIQPDSGQPDSTSAVARPGRLAGKVAVVTGAAGNLGQQIVRRYLEEGATVVLTGRDRARTEAARAAAIADMGVADDKASIVVMDGADAESVRAGIAEVVARHGSIDVLVNNAGSAGPKQPVDNLPLSLADLEALRAAGSTDTETVGDAARNIMVVAWNLVRAAAGAMGPGGSIINVSTIFSRTDYYARAAYTVPKAALNALSRRLAVELGPQGIRVNLLFPGPIASDRIRTVFAAMDSLRGDAQGATAAHFFGQMALARPLDGAAPVKTFPLPADIANTCVFLGSDESAAFSGHDFEVTHGMQVPRESFAAYVSRPTMRTIDGSGLGVLVSAGSQTEDGVALARVQVGHGANVLLGFHSEAAAEGARALVGDDARIMVAHFPRHEHVTMDAVLAEFTANHCAITGALVLPTRPAGYFAGALSEASDAMVERFVDDELEGNIAVARTLSRYWKEQPALLHDPRFVFISNGDDGQGNHYADLLRAAQEELIRVWRDESKVDVAHGRRAQPEWGNQIVRTTNAEAEELAFAAGQAARIVLKQRRIEPINLLLPASIAEATGARKAMGGKAENITGLHRGKVALITGGSAGIGGQVARLLALAGAKVMMVARRASELDAARDRIVGELEDIGFSGVERRVRTLADVDVADLASLKRAFDETVKAFGRVDYLINNAGISGAEEMAVDMSVEAFRRTQMANLVSNYALMQHAVPLMKAQGSGYILNVSSYFGGEKFLAVSYPNRSDYAVSKAGQRAMAESLARHLGPEVQINAIAPGPVDGDRLAGLGGNPGLFERRGRLILENKRLNAVYAALVKAMRRGEVLPTLLGRLARNDTVQLSHDKAVPAELRELALACAREGDETCCWDRFLLTPPLAEKLLKRLALGGYLLTHPEWTARAANGDWLLRVPPDDAPWLPGAQIAREAGKVRGGVLSQLHLGKMPTESEVAQATVFFLADRAVSGETFMPSGGLNVERSTTERELFGSPKAERLEQMAGKTVWLIGEHLVDHLAAAAKAFLGCGVARVVLLCGTEAGGAAIQAAIGSNAVSVRPIGSDIEGGIDSALGDFGWPTTVVSTPMQALPTALFDGPTPLTGEGFGEVVEHNLTQHFRVTRKVSLFDGCQLVLVSPDVPMGEKGPAFALANFVKTTLHAFTATVAVENERLVHEVPVNQINLTRRVRSEEPRTPAEHDEEVARFARAVLLAGAPLPDAEDSRYRAKVYRGQAITV